MPLFGKSKTPKTDSLEVTTDQDIKADIEEPPAAPPVPMSDREFFTLWLKGLNDQQMAQTKALQKIQDHTRATSVATNIVAIIVLLLAVLAGCSVLASLGL